MAPEAGSISPALGPLEIALRRSGLTIAVAESCTGGLLSAALTDLPGSSDFFLGGLVMYANDTKVDLVGVSAEVIHEHGAVSPEVAALMAEGASRAFSSDVGVGVTGIAGPASEGEKPVGLTYIGVHLGDNTVVREYRWSGGRAANRVESVEAALRLATELLS